MRIVAATNRDLKGEADAGKFRLDLYYRLSVFSIELPPLSQRRADILPIAKHYLKEFSAKVNKPDFKMSEGFSALLLKHSWKGNIRELKNVMERVAILADGEELDSSLLPYEFHTGEVSSEGDAMKMETVEKQHIIKVLKHTRGNKTETARLLGIGLTTLYRKIEELKINTGN